MPKDVIITPASGLIDFQGNTGISSATIQLDNNGNLNIANPSGDLTIGSADRDVYIGDGINNVDIIFEQSGEIRALTGKTLSIGQTDSYVRVAGQLLGEIDLIEGPLLIGTGTSTGTASQRLQVTGGAYVSGNLGIGTTNPTSKLSVVGDGNFTGVVTATTFFGALTGTATSTTNIPNLSGDVSSNNTVTTLATVNSNVGTYGDAGAIPSITVNAKGLVTGVTTVAPNNGQLSLAVSGTGLSGSATFTANQSGSSTFTVTSNATDANTPSTIVARDASGNFSAGTITANLTGTATTATNLADAANITTGTINSARLSGTYNINVSYASTAGIATVAQGLTGTPNITVGVVTATSFVKSGGTSSQFLKADGSVDSSTYLTTTGSGTNLTGIVTSIVAGTNITISGSTGQVTINAASGGGGSGTFDTGITTSIYVSVTSGIGTGVSGITTIQSNNDIFRGPGIAYSFPSTAGRKYVIESIHITNTFSNELYFTARHDFNGGSNVPLAQRVLIPYQGASQFLNQPIIANPSDILRFQALSGAGSTATGIDGGLDAFIVYSQKTDTNYIGTGKTVSTASGTEIFQSSSSPAMLQSIKLCNYNLNIDVDASISIYRGGTAGGITTTGVRLGYLTYNLTIPKNSVIEILEKPAYLATNDSIVGSASTSNSIAVTLSGKYIV